MREIVPGIHHWVAIHERIRQPVHSYYVEPAGALIDPMGADEDLAWFAGHGPPRVVLLTNRHHYRHAGEFARAFGCPVRCSEPGLDEFRDGEREVEPFAFGDQVAPGITALEVGAICPDETALHIDHGAGAIAFADGLIQAGGGALGFVPDFLMDDPPAVKAGLRKAFARLLELEFDTLLMAHGEPLVGTGREALSDFLHR